VYIVIVLWLTAQSNRRVKGLQ